MLYTPMSAGSMSPGNFCHEDRIVGMSNYVAYGVSPEEWVSKRRSNTLDFWLQSVIAASISALLAGWGAAKDRLLITFFNGDNS